MYQVEKEILAQGAALQETACYLQTRREMLHTLFADETRPLLFFGCGSSYMLAGAGAALFTQFTARKAVAVAAGDYLNAPAHYTALLPRAVAVVITRSGRTGELARTVALLQQAGVADILCLHAAPGSPIPAQCRYELALPWAYDEAICQTRNISCFYFTLAYLFALAGNKEALLGDLQSIVHAQDALVQRYAPTLDALAQRDWRSVVVLCDGAMNPLAQEGALAFNEISMRPAQCFHLLDYRHGPMVLLGAQSLVVAMLRDDTDFTRQMVADLAKTGCTLVTAGGMPSVAEAHLHVALPACDYTAWGIPFLYLCQRLALARAVADGHNPDQPAGLQAYITV